MQNQPTNFKDTLILYYALLLGQFLMCIVLVYLSTSAKPSPTLDMSFADIKQFLVILLVPASIMISHYLYNNKIREGKMLKDFEEKLMHFRASSILRWALLEGVNLINLVFFFLSKNYFFLLMFAFGFLFFLFTRPSENSFTEDYKLNFEEKQALKENLKKPIGKK